MYRLLWKNQPPEGVLRIFGIPLIIVTAVLLVVVGFGEKQISPVIGLLGTVAGYLLGRNTATIPPDEDQNRNSRPEALPAIVPPTADSALVPARSR